MEQATNREPMMNKDQVISLTIEILENIDVPVKLDDQIAQPVKGAIRNLRIVQQLIQVEAEANRPQKAAEEAAEDEWTETEGKIEKLFSTGEADENGPETDPE